MTEQKRKAKRSLALLALAAMNACATLDNPSGAGTGGATSALNATPTVANTTSLAAGHERTHGGACALLDAGNSHWLVVAAFGYKATVITNTFDVFDKSHSPNPAWIASGTVQDAGPTNTASAAEYVDAITDPNDNTKCYFGGGDNRAGSVFKQMWQVQVTNGVAAWTKKTDMPVARSHFHFAVSGTTTIKILGIAGVTTVSMSGVPTGTTANIDSFSTSGNAWTTAVATMPANTLRYDYGIDNIDGTKTVVGNGRDNSLAVTSTLVAIKSSANAATVTATKIVNGMGVDVIAARTEGGIVRTGRTSANSAIGGTDAVEVAAFVGTDGSNLVTTAESVVIEFNTVGWLSTTNCVSAPANSTRWPTIVNAMAGTPNPGIFFITGVNQAGTTVVNKVQKWSPDTSGSTCGAWNGTVPALTHARTGVEGAYVPDSTDYVLAISGESTDPPIMGTTDSTDTDIIQ